MNIFLFSLLMWMQLNISKSDALTVSSAKNEKAK